ncbi:MAG: ubiquinone/menaquinone biosynthesis methyltransferase, partial [Alphaproteobacteria bacterium]|nr:ubiquinone/menaquinone biosynthesis methyltransferase [Alphaproteobacteria bacterium]
CDINNSMLEVGQDRAMDKGILHGLDWICAPAESLPFPDDHFDAYTIAFGLRNVTDRAKALQEAHRVLKPGGKFCCLEFSQVTLPGLDKLYDLYSFNVIPKIGECVTGDRDSYQYLVESIQRFPKQKALLKELQDVGFENVTYRNFTGGVVALHMALKK